MPLKGASNILSMDVVQLSRYVRRRFHVSLLGTDDVDESRDLAFQILALKNGLENNRPEHLKIFYNLLQASHQGFFSHKSVRNLYIGFPHLHHHYKENYRTFAGETPTPACGIGDSLLINAGSFLSQHTFACATSHLGRLSNDDINRYLHKSHQFDDDVRLNRLLVKILAELLMKRSLPEEVAGDLKNVLTTAVKSWELTWNDEHNIHYLLDLLVVTAALGVEDSCVLSLIERARILSTNPRYKV
ncbi:hypothetical protein X943_000041 [Babesia divergens]|uniref:Uncharacterized protein n=1 Tax=Babesia divergens TaxID=32595 RepID=A0AAD9GCG8_BABDI|nr:hypothetical protein X943_000041 [Babesia divergens]